MAAVDEFALFGRNLFGDPISPPSRGPVADDFIEPPFTVLDARSGYWQDRKAAWVEMGLKGEVGRQDDLAGASWGAEWMRKNGDSCERDTNGTSVFDPALCELMYRWFCPSNGLILDPFAGGSVRGVVAGLMGYRYHGIELRPEQVAANRAQAAQIAPHADIVWREGDSRTLLADAPEADLVFTCPPYGDLEEYSDLTEDLSAMPYADFCAAYRDIIAKAIARLKPNRFACVVVGEFRDQKTGIYRGFVPFTTACVVSAGANY